MARWQVQDAKTRVSEVIDRARTEGPQTITRHGEERAIVISIEDYRALVAHQPDFKAHLLGGPKVDDLSIDRDRDTGRRIYLGAWRRAIFWIPTSSRRRARSAPMPGSWPFSRPPMLP